MLNKENEFLDSVFTTYDKGSLFEHFTRDAYLSIYKDYLKASDYVLEMGCQDGYTSILLSHMVGELDVIDGSKKMLEMLNERIVDSKADNIRPIYSLFEEITCLEKYDAICCSYVLEHVLDPVEILNICYKALKKDGVMLITVPNAMALSRQMAVEMEFLDNVFNLTENDLKHGHRRVYDMETLIQDVEKTNFEIVDKGGTFVKQFADFQINKMIDACIITDIQLKGMQRISKKYPDISGSIYLILKKI